MEKHQIVISCLHTGEAAPLYQASGWQSVGLHRTVRTMPLASFAQLPLQGEGAVCRSINVQKDEDLLAIRKVYQEYSPHFNGPLQRDHLDYWKQWVAYEFTREHAWTALLESQGQVIGYASCWIKHKDGSVHLKVREFGINNATLHKDGVEEAFYMLCNYLCQQFVQSLSVEPQQIKLIYFSAIEQYFTRKQRTEIEHEESHTLDGFMVNVINKECLDKLFAGQKKTLDEMFDECPDSDRQTNGGFFVFWETDSF